jgi:hypothetical protein
MLRYILALYGAKLLLLKVIALGEIGDLILLSDERQKKLRKKFVKLIPISNETMHRLEGKILKYPDIC